MANNGLSTHNKTTAAHSAPVFPVAPPASAPPGSEPRCEIVLVTPELAAEWLKANTFNRRIQKRHVRQMANDLLEGRWPFNPQPISFGTDSSLLDGQHRLTAIVLAGVPVRMAVWFNVPLDARRIMDTGKTRSLSDVASITKSQAAVVNAMLRGMNHHPIATMSEKVVIFNRFTNEINFVLEQMSSAPKRGIGQAAVLGAITRASFHVSADEIAHFCKVLATGMPEQPRDATVIRLRDRLLQVRNGGGTTTSNEVYAYTISALRAFTEGRTLSKIYAASSDPYPLPTVASE